jgi:hypothetical protein
VAVRAGSTDPPGTRPPARLARPAGPGRHASGRAAHGLPARAPDRPVEPSLWTILRDREHILRWAWVTRHKFDRLDEQLAQEAPHVTVVRLRSGAEAERWLGDLVQRRDER